MIPRRYLGQRWNHLLSLRRSESGVEIDLERRQEMAAGAGRPVGRSLGSWADGNGRTEGAEEQSGFCPGIVSSRSLDRYL